MRRQVVLGAILSGGAVVLYASVVRPRQLRWGATKEEFDGTLPGDGIVGKPDLAATRAITIAASATTVWPWIAQLGQGRGGFYSYDFVENLVGCQIHSADRVVPEWQKVEVGDQIKLAPEVGLTVALMEPGESLVLRGAIPMGKAAAPYDFTWAFVLQDQLDGTTRLLVRERYRYLRWWARLVVEPSELVSFVMSQKMLREIGHRAVEASAYSSGWGCSTRDK